MCHRMYFLDLQQLDSWLLHSQQIAGPPTFGMAGWALASIAFENCHFMPLFGVSLLGTGGLFRVPTLDVWSRRPKLLSESEAQGSHCLEMVISTKNRALRKVPPFLKSGHISWPPYCMIYYSMLRIQIWDEDRHQLDTSLGHIRSLTTKVTELLTKIA